MAGVARRAETFDAVPESVRAARRFMRETLEALEVPEPPLDNAILLGNELVTNAVKHARTRFDVRLAADHGRVRVEVSDSDTGSARLRSAGADDTSGRGLAIVDLIADRWGVEERADGKAVWVELLV